MQTPSVNSSGIGVDRGLVSILRPEQTVCTWYVRALDAGQVLSTAISIPYMEKGTCSGHASSAQATHLGNEVLAFQSYMVGI